MYWDAIGILEEAVHFSPSNAQIKLLLVRLYSVLGKCGVDVSLLYIGKTV